MNKNAFNRALFKTSKWAGYVMGVLILLYIITGYGMTKEIIDPVFAKALHSKWMPIPLAITFLLHLFIYIRFKLRLLIKSDLWVDIYLVVLSLVIFLGFLYLYFL